MKKTVLVVLSVIMAFGIAQAQERMIVEKTDGTKIEFAVSDVARVYFEAPATEYINGYEAIDLGLSVKWATCNIGATSPEEHGNHFEWGLTTPIEESNAGSWATYGKDAAKLRSEGYIDDNNNLTTEHDAATQLWGGTWRMPTVEELRELKEKCTITWSSLNGVDGYSIVGPNGNSIFLPAAGLYVGSTLYESGEGGRYWSATFKSGEYASYCIGFKESSFDCPASDLTYGGLTIRPVSGEGSNQGGGNNDDTIDITEYISAMCIGGSMKMVNTLIQYGSVINWRFSNNSNETVHLVSMQLIDGETNEAGNEMSIEADVAAESSVSYSTTIGLLGIHYPVTCKFKYIYNGKEYIVSAEYKPTRQ